MFIGHYAVGFIIKKKANEIPLWLILIGLIAFCLVSPEDGVQLEPEPHR